MITKWEELNFFQNNIDKEIKSQIDPTKAISPPPEQIFRAFELTPFEKTKVVIIGQDPYPQYGYANGLAFSVNKGITIPPSLNNIFDCIQKDYPGLSRPKHGDLTSWARQGVLLINSVLTVEVGKPTSHAKLGWQALVEEVCEELSSANPYAVFILMGAYARKFVEFINPLSPTVIVGHPSPLNTYTDFIGSNAFRKVNNFLGQTGQTPINWALPD